jgi:hypothetical protein
MHTCTYIHMQNKKMRFSSKTKSDTCVCVCLYVCACVCVLYIYIYIYIHTYICKLQYCETRPSSTKRMYTHLSDKDCKSSTLPRSRCDSKSEWEGDACCECCVYPWEWLRDCDCARPIDCDCEWWVPDCDCEWWCDWPMEFDVWFTEGDDWFTDDVWLMDWDCGTALRYDVPCACVYVWVDNHVRIHIYAHIHISV